MASIPMPSLPEAPATAINPVMVIVLVCLISAFFMLCLVSTYFRHYTQRQLRLAASTTHGSETGSMRLVARGLDPVVIAMFASFRYSTVKGIKLGQTALECAVCLNEFQDHETLRLIPKCSHVFHRECIDTWLASHVTCPVCRADLVITTNELSQVTELHCPVDLQRDCDSTEFLLPVESKQVIPPISQMPRSHSTGHSLVVQPVENMERYTLRLPNEARGMFMNLTSLPTSPHMGFPMESSERMTFRSVSVGSIRRPDHYAQYERSNTERLGGETSGGGSSVATGAIDSTLTSNSQRFFRSVRSPFNRLFPASNRNLDV